MNRLVFIGLLAGILAGTAYCQARPYGNPAGAREQHGAYGRQQANPYNSQTDNRYYQDQDPTVDVGFFYNELSPYGEWVRHPRYGWVWFPRHVQAGWRPYSLGRWVETEYGWTWVSSEPFGWATYHYGRWAWDPQFGWLWVPGTHWGPAWVSWQQGNGYVGWAPLPPAVGFQVGIGLQLGGLNISLLLSPRDYSFVPERRFLDANIGGYFVPQARNVTIIHNTTNITNYTVVNNRVINHGVPVGRIEKATGRRPGRYRIDSANNPGQARVQRDVIRIYRPAKNRLDTVKVGRRNDAGLRQTQQDHQEKAPPPVWVAPRARTAPAGIDERQFQREQKDLKKRLDKEQRDLEQIHRQEAVRAKAKADAQAVSQRHAAEMKALQEQRQRDQKQLQTRQEIERKAARASAVKTRESPKQDKAKDDKKKKGDKKPNQK
jgi:hypothetical protein